jgi:hypothetical protein
MLHVRDTAVAIGLVLTAGLLLWPFWTLGGEKVVLIVSVSCIGAMLLSEAAFVRNALLACISVAASRMLELQGCRYWLDTYSPAVFFLCLVCFSLMTLDMQAAIKPATAIACGAAAAHFLPVTDFNELTMAPPFLFQLLLVAAAPISFVISARLTRGRTLYSVSEPYLVTLFIWMATFPFVKLSGFALSWLLIHFWLFLCVPTTCAWLVATLPQLIRRRLMASPR